MVALKNPVSVLLHLAGLQVTDEFGQAWVVVLLQVLEEEQQRIVPAPFEARCAFGGRSSSRGASGRRSAVAYGIRRRVRIGRVVAPLPNPAVRLRCNRRGPRRRIHRIQVVRLQHVRVQERQTSHLGFCQGGCDERAGAPCSNYAEIERRKSLPDIQTTQGIYEPAPALRVVG